MKISYILTALLAFPLTALADTAAIDKALTSYHHEVELVQQTQHKVNRVKTALKRYYTANVGSWPSNLNDLSSVYDGGFKTPIGNITGSQNGLRFNLSINLTSSDETLISKINTMAERNNGSVSGSVVTFSVEPDKSIAAMESSLSRFEDPSGELNKMHTSIDVNSQNIDNVNDILVNSVQFGTANLTTSNITTESVGSKSVSGANTVTTDNVTNLTVTNNNLDNSTVSDLVVSNTNSVSNAAVINANSGINVNGIMITDSSGQLYTDGQDLKNRYIGVTDIAKNSERLGGIDSSLYVRKDATNYFTAVQKFNGGLNASTINSSSLATNTINTSSKFKTNTGTVGNIRVGNTWFSNTKNQSRTNENEIRKLENISAIRKIGRWRYKGAFRKGPKIAYEGGACINLNSWGYFEGEENVYGCWRTSGGRDQSGDRTCGYRAETVVKSYICR